MSTFILQAVSNFCYCQAASSDSDMAMQAKLERLWPRKMSTLAPYVWMSVHLAQSQHVDTTIAGEWLYAHNQGLMCPYMSACIVCPE